MHMKNAIGKFANWLCRIYQLPDQVRRIVVQAEVAAGEPLEHLAPKLGRSGKIFSAGPFVLGIAHRAMLNGDENAAILSVLDNCGPAFLDEFPIIFDRASMIAANESVDDLQAELLRGGDYSL